MLGCPLEGVAADSVLDAGPALRETVDKYLGDPRVLQPAAQVQDVDLGLRAALHQPRDQRRLVRRRHRPGRHARLRPLGRRRPVDQPDASPSGSACSSVRTRCSDVWAGVTSVFRDYGYRRSRNHARLKFLMADWGPEKFRQVLQDEYLHRALPDGPPPPAVARAPRPHRRRARRTTACSRSAPPPSRDARRAPRCASWPTSPTGSAAAATALTAQQGIVVLDVPEANTEDAGRRTRRARLLRAPVGVPARDDRVHRHRVLQARPRRDEGPRRDDPAGDWRSGCPTSTRRSRSTSTAARTRAPASRSPTSASRAWCRRVPDGDAGRLPGAPRRSDGRERGIRAQVPWFEGDSRGSTRLRRARAARISRPARRRRDRSPTYVLRAEEDWLL